MRIGIIGGSGYTGVELLRLLSVRDDIDIVFISSRAQAGTRVDALFPSLRGHVDLLFSDPDDVTDADCDLVFFATPNGTAMKQAPALLEKGIRVVDLSADFRLKDVPVWEQWYGMQHASAEWVERAVYGLPEMNRDSIRDALLVANPGCYPTTVQLGFLPLLEAGIVDTETLIADAKSGITGAGRGASVPNLLAESADSFRAYGVAGHRHLPEIEQGLAAMSPGPVSLTFTPHLLPIIRGIHATLYARLTQKVDLQALFEERFGDEPFVDVMPAGAHPETRSVRGTNMCRLAVHQPQGRDTAVVLAVEDNLVKGAAGQAIQNMNLMLGLPETRGLQQPALMP
ncbi:N-acetyl-gamma-glutamyl-phosphate reductase [Granulosicoccus sp. 3-233]|uniref:N-acetyl-gamma-glutamyl-phosphate reductase n=1 Tax=Granulosicoccus sp. 3-233 TaxID=3417969 RepID=UPI003D34A607